MRFDCLTLFPDMIKNVLNESITGRAVKNNIIDINYINIRDFADNKHNSVDDEPYGGGGGMVMQPGPIYRAYQSVTENLSYKPKVIYMSPQGKVFNQELAKELAKEEHLIFLCGHYEGVDERIIEEIVDYEISIGDYVLTGGEIPAMVVIDSISRLIPGVLSSSDSYTNESHYSGLLEYPQYTRPIEFMGRRVPDVLLSGHHANIEKWRREKSIERTLYKRPDMIDKAELSQEDQNFLEKIKT
ncbi:MAG: tRNA (guanosine(37)-N1)-methyltransferase TrmD [Clostridia bacterium]|nr:tRNA (guanosine(37)-N1)-methyltransferase TrmD [Clostridia bacterium]